MISVKIKNLTRLEFTIRLPSIYKKFPINKKVKKNKPKTTKIKRIEIKKKNPTCKICHYSFFASIRFLNFFHLQMKTFCLCNNLNFCFVIVLENLREKNLKNF